MIPNDVKITPWLGQYKELKKKYPEELLLFRMGDFYELFFDDAKKAASALDIALTARDHDKKIPMAGIPYHALNSYLGRLIKAGYRAAICEQMTEAGSAKLIERKVVRVVTPGTYVPEENSNDNSGHLAAVNIFREKISLALLSVDTGKLEVGSFELREGLAMLGAFEPGEILYPSSLKNKPEFLNDYNSHAINSENFKIYNAAERLKNFLKLKSLDGLGVNSEDACIGCAWAVLDYLSATQFSTMSGVLKISPLISKGYMSIDAQAQRNLELTPELAPNSLSLFTCLDKCRTATGRRTLRKWILKPLMDIKAIQRRQNAIKLLIEDRKNLIKLQDLLAGTRDIERSLSRLALGTGNPRDLGAIRETLRVIPEIKALKIDEPLKNLLKNIPDFSELLDELESALEEYLPANIANGNFIKSEFNQDLMSWREISSQGEKWLEQYLERERLASSTPKLKAGHTQAMGYYLEIGKAGLNFTPPHFERKQTLTNAQRYVTKELRDFQERMNNSEDEIAKLETELFYKVVQDVINQSDKLQMAGKLLGVLDCVASGAEIAGARNFTCPVINESNVFNIKNGRHPVIEAGVKDNVFVPNDINLNDDARIIILTGPNMAGKSTWLRMAAVLAIMAQAGLWIPAESAEIGIIDRVFTRIGAHDDLVRGNSTFMIEMLETANILNNLTDRSLIILDEIGRGTATYDGMSIAWAVLEYLHSQSKARVLFATHCHELICLEERLQGIKNYSMAVSEGDDGIIFLHHVKEGAASRSYGIEVARLAGLPNSVLGRAFELLKIFESGNFEPSKIPDAQPVLEQRALRRQISIFSTDTDAIIQELINLDTDNTTPMQALKILVRLKKASIAAQM